MAGILSSPGATIVGAVPTAVQPAAAGSSIGIQIRPGSKPAPLVLYARRWSGFAGLGAPSTVTVVSAPMVTLECPP